MKNIIFALFSLTFFLSACTRCVENPEIQPEQTGDFVFFAECGECIPFTDKFTIHDGKLLDKDGQVLPDSLFQIAKILQTNLPSLLCASNTTDYGCGSCYDGISYFIQTGCNGIARSWQFDPYDESNPAEVKVYAQQVQEVFRRCTQ